MKTYLKEKNDDFIISLDSILNNSLKEKELSCGAIKSTRKLSAENFAYAIEQLYKNMLLRHKGYEKICV